MADVNPQFAAASNEAFIERLRAYVAMLSDGLFTMDRAYDEMTKVFSTVGKPLFNDLWTQEAQQKAVNLKAIVEFMKTILEQTIDGKRRLSMLADGDFAIEQLPSDPYRIVQTNLGNLALYNDKDQEVNASGTLGNPLVWVIGGAAIVFIPVMMGLMIYLAVNAMRTAASLMERYAAIQINKQWAACLEAAGPDVARQKACLDAMEGVRKQAEEMRKTEEARGKGVGAEIGDAAGGVAKAIGLSALAIGIVVVGAKVLPPLLEDMHASSRRTKVSGLHSQEGNMAEEADVLISWFSSGAVAQDAFQRPTRFIQMPTPPGQGYRAQIDALGQQPIRAIVKKYLPNVRPLRIGLLGFSEGCQGVRQMLASPDGGRIDSAIAIDGVHAQYQPSSKTAIQTAYLSAWTAMAKRAVQGRVLMVMTASSIIPPGFVPVGECANWIWREATGSNEVVQTQPLPTGMDPLEHTPPVILAGGTSGTLKWPETVYDHAMLKEYRRLNDLIILNYANNDPTGHNDHVYQAKVILPLMLQTYLAERWNRIAPEDAICITSTVSGEDAPVNGCFRPTKLTDNYWSGTADPMPLDLDLTANPQLPKEDAAGNVVVATEQEDSTSVKVVKFVGTVAAGMAVAWGIRKAIEAASR